jgi:hypothetical protein
MSERNVKNPLMEYCPDIVESEWFFPYNNVLGMIPSRMGKDSVKPVYWKCPKCSAVYRMAPKKKLECRERNKVSCFSCRGMIQFHPFTV